MKNFAGVEDAWAKGRILPQAFCEQKDCIKAVYAAAGKLLGTAADTPPEFKVTLGNIPEEFFFLRRNIFSTLFQSMYQLLEISRDRRLLYGRLNQLFRIWVTAADNLLDGEDKLVMPMELPGKSRVMRQVIAIMLADRIMKQFLDEAVAEGIISAAESKIISEKSLQILLPSAAEEASEEGGIIQRDKPDYVLHVIHRLKTGILFQIPFLGPEYLEPGVRAEKLVAIKEALSKFGIGCQLLDDIRDMAKDYIERRHNYILSKIYWEGRSDDIKTLHDLESKMTISTKIHGHFPSFAGPASRLALRLLEEALLLLAKCGLDIEPVDIRKMSLLMFPLLDVEDILCQKDLSVV